MGKRYKKGNKGKKHKNNRNSGYMKRERRINRLILLFKDYVLNKPYNISNYKNANRLRLDIKDLLYRQGAYVSNKSRYRRYVYYQQTSDFKGLYVTWKKRTLHLFFKVQYDFPDHIIPCLCIYYRDLKKGLKLSFNIFY